MNGRIRQLRGVRRGEQHHTTIVLYISSPYFSTTHMHTCPALPSLFLPLLCLALCPSHRCPAANHQADPTFRRPPYTANRNRPLPTRHSFDCRPLFGLLCFALSLCRPPWHCQTTTTLFISATSDTAYTTTSFSGHQLCPDAQVPSQPSQIALPFSSVSLVAARPRLAGDAFCRPSMTRRSPTLAAGITPPQPPDSAILLLP